MNDGSLTHVGVMGMKWGHRSGSGNTSILAKAKTAYTTKANAVSAKNAAMTPHQRTIAKIKTGAIKTVGILLVAGIGMALMSKNGPNAPKGEDNQRQKDCQ